MMLSPDDFQTQKWRATNKLKDAVIANGTVGTDGVRRYKVTLRKIKHTFHPELKNIPMWSYGSKSPGVIITAAVNQPVQITWANQLQGSSLEEILKGGQRVGMEEPHMLKAPHNTVHVHGARVQATSDGFPEAVFHPHEGRIFYYENKQPASTLWYHDHAMHTTRLNVYAGLFGAYLLTDPAEASLLPKGPLQIPLVLQDKSFTADGKNLLYMQQTTPDVVPEFVGDFPVVNGQIWPWTELRPRIYRLRLLNGANSRFFTLSLTPESDENAKIPLYVIGTDGGFLTAPAATDELTLAPGERADVLVDLRGFKGSSLILRNSAETVVGPVTEAASQLLKINVAGLHALSDAKFDPAPGGALQLPARVDPMGGAGLPPRAQFAAMDQAIDAVPPSQMNPVDLTASNGVAFKLRRFKLQEFEEEMPVGSGVIAPTVKVNGETWETEVASPLVVQADALEVWEFFNVTPDAHPMHLHLVQFQLMSRTALATHDDTEIDGFGARGTVEDYEKGWKDTVRCNNGESTRIVVRFDGYTGQYVFHCHILEHEDMGMMYRLNVDA